MSTTTTTNPIPFQICPENDNKPFYLDPKCKTSIFTGVKTVERPNTELIHGFLNHKLGISYKNVAKYKCVPYPAEQNQIKEYYKSRDSATDCYDTRWKLQTHGWGRIQPHNHLSLSVFHRPTRHAFAQGRYIDLDMANCHPQFILSICERVCLKEAGMTCEHLSRYVEAPKQVRADIMEFYGVDKNVAKQLPISLLNGGSIKQWKVDNSVENTDDLHIVKGLEKELKPVIEAVWRDNEQIHIDFTNAKDQAYLKKTLPGKKRTIMATFCQTVERIIQERSIMVVADKYEIPLELIIPCQDGFMLPAQYEPLIPDMVKSMQREIGEQYNLDAIWVQKPFDEAMDIPAEPELSDGKPIDAVAFDNDVDAGEYIYKNLSHMFVYCKGTFYMRMDNHVWTTDEKQIKMAIYDYVLHSGVYRPGREEGKYVPYTQNYQSAKNVGSVIMGIAVKREDHLFETKVFHSSLGYTLFTNGYLNWRTGMFIAHGHDDFDDSIIFTEIIPYDFELLTASPEEATAIKENMAYIKETMFYTPFGKEMGDYYILNLARAMAGDCMKRFLFGIGLGNTGKSLLTSAIQSACGGYFGGFNAANLVHKPSSQDEAQLMRWAMLLRHKRIIISNEIKKGTPLDGNAIKRLSNGGLDTLTGRGHGGNETNFKVPFLAICFANDIDTIKPFDDAIENRVRAIPYTKVCVDKDEKDINPKYEIVRNTELMTEIEEPEFKMAFISILVESYIQFCDGGRVEIEPEGVSKACANTFGENQKIIDLFLEEFEFTNDPEDFVVSSDFKLWLDDKKSDVSTTKLGSEISRHAGLHGHDQVKTLLKKIGRKPVRIWPGIRRIPHDLEEEV